MIYLPPIHPIGVTNRKGANNALTAGPDDPGSPWAIGSAAGGHEAIDPGLGTLADFEALVAAAHEQGMEIALDFALNCSADHPWLTEHPEWFNHRPDGTLKYAENPPKKYQDIYNLNFDSEDWRGALGGAARHRPALGRARRPRLPRRQPAHQADAVLGVADRRGARRPPGRDLPRRGLHPAGEADDAGEARLQPVLHLLHLEELALGADRVRQPSSPTSTATTAGRTSSPTPRTSSPSTWSTAARRPSRRASSWRRRSRPPTASTPASRTSRTCRSNRAARSTWTRRSTSCASAPSTARCCRWCRS